jgi:hypothetical protein
MIAFNKTLIAAGLLAVAGVSRVAAADVDDGSRAVSHAHWRAAEPHRAQGYAQGTTVGFDPEGENRRCVGCH